MNRSVFPLPVLPSISPARLVSLCLSLMLGILLAACGGGSGKVGLPTGTALFTTASGTVNLAAGASSTYSIGGGTPTYTATSSNRDVATASASGTSLSITAVAAGSANITVTDAAGASTVIAVAVSGPVVTPPAGLFTTAAGAVSLPVSGNASYAIGGGKAPYAVSSSNAAVVAVAVSGSNFLVTGLASGAAQVVITDATGTALELAVTVGSGTPTPLYTTAPSAITVSAGGNASFTIGGGRPAYIVSSSNTGVAQVVRSGNNFQVNGIAAGSAQIVIVDAGGTTLSLEVTVGSGGSSSTAPALFTSAPGNVVVDVGATATYAIGGGRPAYAVSSSNSAVARVAINGTAFIVTGMKAGTAQILVSDAQGDSLSVGVTVGSGAPGTPATFFTTAPASASVAVSGTESYALAGGTAPYAVSSSNSAVARVVLTGSNYVITGVAAGSATISAFDANGATVATSVTVGAGGPGIELFTTAPAAVTIVSGDTASFTVGGGSAPYAVTSSNTAVAKVALSGTTFTITSLQSGTAQVIVSDAQGNSLSIGVTAGSGAPGTPAAFFTTAPVSASLAVGASDTYTLAGGSAPYAVSSSNAAVARVTLSGTSYVISGVSAGTATVSAFDANGASVATTVTVGASGPGTELFTTAPAAVTMAAGATATFAVSGGKAPYAVSTGNAGVARIALTDNNFTITAVAQGSAQVRVIDADGTALAIAVTVPAPPAGGDLFTTAPDNVTLAAGTAVGYTIGGGSAPYNATTSNPAVATAAISGATLTVNAVAAGTATIRISDAAGAAELINVTVTQAAPTAITVNPAAATGNVGDALNFLISGGTPAYTVTINNTSIATVAPATVGTNGGAFVITLRNVGTTTATITDAQGQVATVPISASQTTTILRLSPSALIVGENVAAPISLNIFGGTGPYTVFTSDETKSSVSVSGSVVTVNGVGPNGTRCITPMTADGTYVPYGTYDVIITTVDSLGASATSTISIQDNGMGAGTGCT